MYALLIFNGKTAGNLKLAQKSEADDGLFRCNRYKSDVIKNALNNLFIIATKRDNLRYGWSFIYICFKTDD